MTRYSLINSNNNTKTMAQKKFETLQLRLRSLKETHFTSNKATGVEAAGKLVVAEEDASNYVPLIGTGLGAGVWFWVLFTMCTGRMSAMIAGCTYIVPIGLLYAGKVITSIRESRVYTNVFDCFFQRIGAYRVLKDYVNYAQIAQDDEMISVSTIAKQASQSVRTVTKRLRRMQQMHLLEKNALDEQEGMLFLTDKARKGYMDAIQKNRKEEMVASCRNHEILSGFVKKIRQHNDILPDEEISGALDVTENLLLRILQEVEKDPSVDGKLRRTASYYLPQIDKLLEVYYDLYVNKRDFVRTKEVLAEIVSGVEMLNGSLKRILEDLILDVAMRVDTDLKVMKMMLEQEGL